MPFTMLSNQLMEAQERHIATLALNPEHRPTTRPLARLTEIVRGVSGRGRQTLHDAALDTFLPLVDKTPANPGSGDRAGQRTDFGDMLTEVTRGNRPVERRALLQWLYEQHEPLFATFLREYGLPYPDIARLPPKYGAFLCWSGPYGQEICEAIRRFLRQEFKIAAFMSSYDIVNGDTWREAISNSLKSSARGLVIVTQDSIGSDYLPHEFSVLSHVAESISTFLLDAPASVLPASLRDYQHQVFSIDGCLEWIQSFAPDRKITSAASISLQNELNGAVRKYRDLYVTSDDRRWKDNYRLTMMMSHQGGSPFDLEQVFKIARQRLIIIAQNHRFMTKGTHDNPEMFWNIIKSSLKTVEIDIVGMHPSVAPSGEPEDAPDAHLLWSHYMKSHDFHLHVKETWEVLAEWAHRYEVYKSEDPTIKPLKIYGAYFTPLTMSIIDPEDSERGLLVLSPRPAHEGSFARPQFILRKKYESEAFRYFYGTVDNSYDNAGWRHLNKEEMRVPENYIVV